MKKIFALGVVCLLMTASTSYKVAPPTNPIYQTIRETMNELDSLNKILDERN